MDFFARQEAARRSTGRLLVLYGFAIAAIILAVHALFSLLTSGGAQWFTLSTFPVSCGITLLVVFAGVGVGKASLSAGGRAVAEMCGGRPVEPGSRDPAERRFLNVVEEMAIASGVPMPALFVLEDELGINAFAAGHNTGDFAVAVSRGCLDQLDRDELQGVVAHEFSHILNNDMRRNLNLTGWLYGIMGLALIGRILFEIAGRSGRSRSKDSGQITAALFLFGLGLLLIGWVGQFFARAIQAAISRQREHLADASAVQFTRNPEGIANALKKIAGYPTGSNIANPRASAMAHMFFASALNSLFATHPPLEERIKLLDPHFNPELAQLLADEPSRSRVPAAASGFTGGGPPPLPRAAKVTRQVGSLAPAQINHAAGLLAALPAPLVAATHEPLGASALVYGLLLDAEPAIRAAQLARLQQTGQPACLRELNRLGPKIAALPTGSRLPLASLATAALRRLSPAQYTQFRRDVDALIEADNSVDLFEFALQKNLRRHLDPQFLPAPARATQHYPAAALLQDGAVLLSCLAHLGAKDRTAQAAAFQAGAMQLGTAAAGLRLLPLSECNLAQVDAALDRLAAAAPRVKKVVIEACAHAVAHDGFIHDREAELLRAIGDSLDCPLPPLLQA